MRRAVLIAARALAGVLVTQGHAGQPPALTRHPMPQRVVAGHTLRLFGGSGDTSATFAWEREDLPIPDQRTPELTMRHIRPEESGRYFLIARNSEAEPGLPAIGESASRPAEIIVLVPPAAPGVVDLGFGDAALNGGEVRRIEPLPDGGALIVGTFESAGARLAGGMLKLLPDGAPDPNFVSHPGAQGGRIRTLARHGDGWVIGGDFTQVHGTAASRVARLTSQGALDPVFRPPPLTSTVRALATQEIGGESRVLIGLSAAPWLVRLRADGALDTAFGAQIAAAGLNGRVSALAVQPDGRLLIGGMFFQDTRWPFRRIGRLSSAGQPDTSDFVHGAGTGADGEVLALGLDRLGRIMAGGAFATMHGQDARFLTRLTPTGQVDPNFRARPDDSVQALAVLDDASLMIAGLFTRVGGRSSPSVARLLPTGDLDPSWQPAAMDGFATCVAMAPGGRVLVGGDFQQPHRGVVALRSEPHAGPPLFFANPVRQSWTEGQGASLSVAAHAGPDSVFSWYRRGEPQPFLRTTTGEWIVQRVATTHAGQYEVEISNAQGAVRSPLIEVAVHAASPGERPHDRGLPDAPLGLLPDQGERVASLPLPASVVDEIRVTVAIDHRDINDLVIDLRSPTGRTVRLFDPDEPSEMRGGQNLDFTVFADSADTLINTAPAPCTGVYRPSAPLVSFRGPHPQGTWQISVVDTRDDGIVGDLKFVAIDAYGPRPALDSTTLATVIPPDDDDPVLVIDSITAHARYRHWQPAGGPSPLYEWAPDLGRWETLLPAAQLRQRRYDDQSATAWLRLPDPGAPRHGFLRARWP